MQHVWFWITSRHRTNIKWVANKTKFRLPLLQWVCVLIWEISSYIWSASSITSNQGALWENLRQWIWLCSHPFGCLGAATGKTSSVLDICLSGSIWKVFYLLLLPAICSTKRKDRQIRLDIIENGASNDNTRQRFNMNKSERPRWAKKPKWSPNRSEFNHSTTKSERRR